MAHMSPDSSPDSDVTVSMLEALKKRYSTEYSPDEQMNINCEIILAKPRNIYHSDSLHIPCSVNLDSLGIASAGEFGEMCELCSHINELSLSSNQITSLKEIIHIMSATPRLEFLNLHSNILQNDLMLPDQEELVEESNSTSPEKEEHVESNSTSPEKEEHVESNSTSPEKEEHVESNSTSPEKVEHVESNSTSPEKEEHVESNSPSPEKEETTDDSSVKKDPPLPASDYSFPNLNFLVLNDTQITWSALHQLLLICPKIQELHLSMSGFKKVELPAEFTYDVLLRLHFNNNEITDWDELLRLGHCFPKLEKLVMTDTVFTYLPEQSQCVSAFPELVALSISNNCLTEWDEVDKLDYFPKLKQVRLNGSELLKDLLSKECTALLIARLPHIQNLNGREVLDKEREDAERFFLRYYKDREDKPSRYNDLRLLHGDIKPLLDLNLSDNDLNVNMIYLEKKEKMTLDQKKSVKELKLSLKEFVGLPPSKFRLLHIAKSPEPSVLAIMDVSDRSLHSFRIRENDEIHVQLK